MKHGMRFICGFGLWVLVVETIASADTKSVVDCTCPLCDTKFKATLAGSGTQFGQRLDLRPLGRDHLAVAHRCLYQMRFRVVQGPGREIHGRGIGDASRFGQRRRLQEVTREYPGL